MNKERSQLYQKKKTIFWAKHLLKEVRGQLLCDNGFAWVCVYCCPFKRKWTADMKMRMHTVNQQRQGEPQRVENPNQTQCDRNQG